MTVTGIRWGFNDLGARTIEPLAPLNAGPQQRGFWAWQLAEAMKEQKLSRNKLAQMMHTSRTQVRRLLDPDEGNVTIESLQRAAAVVGRRVQLELV